MADYGIKISKEGVDALTVPTETNKKDFVILDTVEAHKVFFKGFITAGSYTHNLGYKPIFFCFKTDSTSSPTYFILDVVPRATTTQITNISNPSYLVVMYEGI